MNNILIDNLVVIFSLVFYAFLCVVYVLRSYQREKEELKLALVFSLQLVPFMLLWILNIYMGGDSGRLIAGFPIIVFLLYDLWYRLLTKKKPVHHPDHWPRGLILYIILLQIGCIALNWYGFLVAKVYGNMLVISFFVMLGCFGFYQVRHKRWKKNNR